MQHSRGKTGTFRRVIKHASICLLLGAIVNVGVAWGFAWFTPTFIYSESSNFGVFEARIDKYGVLIRDVAEMYFESDSIDEEFAIVFIWTNDYGGFTRYLVYSDSRQSGPVNMLTIVKSGFPMNCLSYNYWTEGKWGEGLVKHLSSNYALIWNPPGPAEINNDRVVSLPLRPLWPAIAINTIFYGVILWMLFVMPFVLRRWRRSRRGLCIKCGYDLRGDHMTGCPECGWNRVGKETKSASDEKMK